MLLATPMRNAAGLESGKRNKESQEEGGNPRSLQEARSKKKISRNKKIKEIRAAQIIAGPS